MLAAMLVVCQPPDLLQPHVFPAVPWTTFMFALKFGQTLFMNCISFVSDQSCLNINKGSRWLPVGSRWLPAAECIQGRVVQN